MLVVVTLVVVARRWTANVICYVTVLNRAVLCNTCYFMCSFPTCLLLSAVCYYILRLSYIPHATPVLVFVVVTDVTLQMEPLYTFHEHPRSLTMSVI